MSIQYVASFELNPYKNEEFSYAYILPFYKRGTNYLQYSTVFIIHTFWNMLDHFDHSQTFNGKANQALRRRDYLDRLFTIFLYLSCSKYSNAVIVT